MLSPSFGVNQVQHPSETMGVFPDDSRAANTESPDAAMMALYEGAQKPYSPDHGVQKNSPPKTEGFFGHLEAATDTSFASLGLHGVNARPVEVFNSGDYKKRRSLAQLRETVQSIPQQKREHSPTSVPGISAQSGSRVSADEYAQRRQEELKKVRARLIAKQKQNPALVASGSHSLVETHTNQSVSLKTGTVLNLFTYALNSLTRKEASAQKMAEVRRQQLRAHKAKTQGLEGNDRGQVDMQSKLQEIAARIAPHEQGAAGE